MTAAEAKALLDTLFACGATAEKVADAAKPLVGRTDRPAIDGLVAAGLTAARSSRHAKTILSGSTKNGQRIASIRVDREPDIDVRLMSV